MKPNGVHYPFLQRHKASAASIVHPGVTPEDTCKTPLENVSGQLNNKAVNHMWSNHTYVQSYINKERWL